VGVPYFRALSILPAVGGPAAAQVPDENTPGNIGTPFLHLAATETSKIAPDELIASMSAIATAPKAVPAQQQVNALVAKAKVLVDKANGIKRTFRGYSVNFLDEKPAHWIAQQAVVPVRELS